MSKFNPILKHLDIKNPHIKPREFPEGVRPFNKQDICYIDVLPYEINNKCAQCAFSGLKRMTGQVSEYGIGGYMSNQKNPLAHTTLRPTEGIKLREPHTIIIADGEAWVCMNKKQGEQGIFMLTEKSLPCQHFLKKPTAKEKE